VNVAEFREEHSRNPFRFKLHFILSIMFMALVFYLTQKSRINKATRKYLYLASIIVFGLGFNSNPSPMGPLKDTISLFGNIPEIFHPRLFALLTYLIIVVAANKFICSWVCQFGVLQDLLFRLNQNRNTDKVFFKQLKIPFILSNSIRIAFFSLTTIISSLWAINIIDPINPFAVFSGLEIKLFGWCFIGIILAASIFVYRPWCHLFCPFGLLSWLFEKLSIYKIIVNYNTCTSCNTCVVSCPSDAMEAILKNKKTLPDCFSCGTCLDECPNGSIKFDIRKSIHLR
jgi:polyferredoxin